MESHQKTIKLAISEAISRAGLKDASEIDGIAVTKGPGLEICLRVGLQQAQVGTLESSVNLMINRSLPMLSTNHL
jgi:tRNA A37 threonylcarbamoyltransferase TsaD